MRRLRPVAAKFTTSPNCVQFIRRHGYVMREWGLYRSVSIPSPAETSSGRRGLSARLRQRGPTSARGADVGGQPRVSWCDIEPGSQRRRWLDRVAFGGRIRRVSNEFDTNTPAELCCETGPDQSGCGPSLW